MLDLLIQIIIAISLASSGGDKPTGVPPVYSTQSDPPLDKDHPEKP